MTAITTMPTPWTQLDNALQERRPVHITYHGRRRLVCPHALGWNNGRPLVLGYQTGGDTSTGTLDPDPRKRWRLMHVDHIEDITAADPATPWGTADNYNPAHPFPFTSQIAAAITPDHRDGPSR